MKAGLGDCTMPLWLVESVEIFDHVDRVDASQRIEAYLPQEHGGRQLDPDGSGAFAANPLPRGGIRRDPERAKPASVVGPPELEQGPSTL